MKFAILIILIVATINTKAQSNYYKLILPNSKQITVEKYGFEHNIYNYINTVFNNADSVQNWFSTIINKNTYDNYDMVNMSFQLGKTSLTPNGQLHFINIATILKAYPKIKINIAVLCDRLGDETANIKLTQARADSIKNYLFTQGVTNKQIVTTKGFGSQYASYTKEASNESRNFDRKIAIQVLNFPYTSNTPPTIDNAPTSGGIVPIITTKEEFDKLAPGAKYIDSEIGKTSIK
jgi:outer membrane protein OmpA-like peptidoglycan-associated protein